MSKRMTLISIILVFAMLLSYFAPFSISNAAADNTFNVNLYKAIKTSLLKDGYGFTYDDTKCKITVEDIGKIKSLDLSNGEIDDLTGLGMFSSVKELDLSGNLLTKDSNLEELNSMSLKKLDLSSNAIEDGSAISNLKNITNLNLHNQKFTQTVVMRSGKENTDEYAYFTLPQIFEYAGRIKASWFKDEEHSGDSDFSIAWTKSDINNLKIAVRKGTTSGDTFATFMGYINLPILIDDSENVLFNTDITLNFISVDDNYDGIIFKDENLYKAVRDQLKRYQTINSDLRQYTNYRTLYEGAYDDALVLVISRSDLDNRITSLKIENKKVKDITGIEHFVGLESQLSLMGNKIENLDKIVELYNNKKKRTQELKAEVNDIVGSIKAKVDLIDAKRDLINTSREELQKLAENDVEIDNRMNTAENKVAEIQAAILEANNKIEEANQKIEEANETLNSLYSARDEANVTVEQMRAAQTQASAGLETAETNLATAQQLLEAAEQAATTAIGTMNNQIESIDGRTAEIIYILANSTTLSEEDRAALEAERLRIAQDKVTLQNQIATYREIELADENDSVQQCTLALQEAQNNLAEATANLNAANENLTNILNNINEVESGIAANNAIINDMANNVIPSKQNELNEVNNQINTIQDEITVSENKKAELQRTINEASSRITELQGETRVLLYDLYNKYTRSYLLTKTTTNDIPDSTVGLSDENMAELLNKQINKLTSMESALSKEETDYLVDLFGIPVADAEGKEIEKPIDTYFKDREVTSSEARSIYSQLINFSAAVISLNNCMSYNAFEDAKSSNIVEHDTDDSSLKDLLYKLTTLSNRNAILDVIGDTDFEDYGSMSNIPGSHIFEPMARKIASATNADIDAVVKLPELLSLNASINRITNLDVLSQVDTLKELNLGSNEITDISSFNWGAMKDLSVINLSFNSLRDVKPLESAPHLSSIDVSDNLIDKFDFNVSSMYSFKEFGDIDLLDFSGNTISDVEPLINQVEMLARENGEEIGDVFRDFNIKLQRQKLYMNLGEVLQGDLKYIDMPSIFAQSEELMPQLTEFDITSFDGNVTSDGSQAIIRVETLGRNQGIVVITNQNGSALPFAYGTTLTIDYNVVTQLSDDDTGSEVVVPGDTTDTSTTSDTTDTSSTADTTDTSSTADTTDTSSTSDTTDTSTTSDTTDTSTTSDTSTTADTTDTSSTSDTSDITRVSINPKYTVDDDMIKVSPKTDVISFVNDVVDGYQTILRKENADGTTSDVTDGYVGTGTILVIVDDNGKAVDAYEIVAKGDVNGDGLANATDSYLIKAHRAEALTLNPIFRKAADINNDGEVDAIDSRLLLFYRAEVLGYEL